ncbi:MAG: hypothetical protein B7Y43_11670 [Sphingomonas sp. 28-62-20]|uniref:hypothetical protein n=1 Tax=Sphingomonas sp. 28-62-20 TaxID=1970433 RepID=UPI000BCB0D11|nr:MAG: hypothetical protein B7Y43_11670 [Sphingomonas sp. 28-62-20]
MKTADFEAIATRVAQRELGNDLVDHVSAQVDMDGDGETIWRLVVVLTEPKNVAGIKLSGFVRHLRAELEPNEPYPIVSFRSASDNRDVTSAAA